MKQLLKIEWLKLKSYRTFWIIIGLYTFILVAWNFVAAYGLVKLQANGMNLLSINYGFPAVWEKVTYAAGWLIVLLCVLVITITSNEFQFKTHRQHIIDGLSRFDFLKSKLGVILAITCYTLIVCFILGILLGVLHGGGNPFVGVYPLFYLFVYSINYLFFAIVITLFIKKSGLSIALFFCYFMFIEFIVSKLLNWKASPIGNFLPLQCSDELFSFPIADMAKEALQLQSNIPMMYYIIASIGYIVLYFFISKNTLEKSDL